jgi:hypothetical protein
MRSSLSVTSHHDPSGEGEAHVHHEADPMHQAEERHDGDKKL